MCLGIGMCTHVYRLLVSKDCTLSLSSVKTEIITCRPNTTRHIYKLFYMDAGKTRKVKLTLNSINTFLPPKT